MSCSCSLIVVLLLFQVIFVTNIFCVPADQKVQFSDDKITNLRNIVEDLKNSLSSTIDPCNDFHSYVCEKNNVSFPYPYYPDYMSTGKIVERYLSEFDLSETETKLKDYLTSCKQAKNDDIKQFVKEFHLKSIGGWPAFDSDWSGDQLDWQAAIAELHTYYIDVVISETFTVEQRENFRGYLIIDVEDYMLFKNENRKESIREKLSQFDVNNVDEVINDAVEFEAACKKVLAASQLSKESRIETDVTGLQKEIPEIDWEKQFEIIAGGRVEGNIPVVLKNREAVRNVIAVVSKMNPKTMANYFFCKFIESIPSLKDPDSCHLGAYEYFEDVIAGMFINRFFKDIDKLVLAGMIHYGLQSMHKPLSDFNEVSVDNIFSVENLINEYYFSKFSDESLKNQYQGTEINGDKFYRNTFLLRRLNSVNHNNFFSRSNQNTPQYIPFLLNSILSHYVFKMKDQPSALIYKDIVIPLLDEYKQAIIKSRHIKSSLKECLKHQMNISESEDIYSGVITWSQMLKGYLEWENRNSDMTQAEDDVFKEYGLSNKKIAFTWFTQITCGAKSLTDTQRVNSMLNNIQEFADTYNCPPGSAMNLEEKCNIEKFM